ncbi:hypothetical protein KAW18_11095 [candidate division WOR-3 bacterium]|jgi:hypothetical protein|nr:hypothetical protein [candidate division WOR-3 bacterium]
MSNTLVSVERTADSIKYNKDCGDFISLEDGTITKEHKYCDRSEQCHQIGIINGRSVQMVSHYLPSMDPHTGEVIEWEYFCTGMYDLRPLKERIDDDKAN